MFHKTPLQVLLDIVSSNSCEKLARLQMHIV